MNDVIEPELQEIATPDLRQIAERIRARRAWAVIETGRDLLKAKKLIGHGDFGTWLWTEAGLADHTARRCMRVARWADSLPEGKTDKLSLLPTTSLYELAAKSTPEPARAAVFEALEAGERLNIKSVEYYISRADRRGANVDVHATAVEEPINVQERGGTLEVLPPEPAAPKKPRKLTENQLWMQEREAERAKGLKSATSCGAFDVAKPVVVWVNLGKHE
jgi:hypothetical protein